MRPRRRLLDREVGRSAPRRAAGVLDQRSAVLRAPEQKAVAALLRRAGHARVGRGGTSRSTHRAPSARPRLNT
jgi:hypothetical protein